MICAAVKVIRPNSVTDLNQAPISELFASKN